LLLTLTRVSANTLSKASHLASELASRGRSPCSQPQQICLRQSPTPTWCPPSSLTNTDSIVSLALSPKAWHRSCNATGWAWFLKATLQASGGSLQTSPSHQDACSVNDGIDPTLCSLSYVSVDTVSAIVSALGTGSLLAKIDIEAAYRLVPVHPDDRPLLGLRWNGEVYCDAMLPFGLRSAAKIFNALADALEWTIRQKGATHIAHYLDDFVIVGAPDSSQCADSLNVVTSTCRELGVPLSTAKCEGPTTRLTFLGIELDTMAGTLRLPSDKLSRVQAVLQAWGDKKTCLRRELESLVGLLHHACKVVRPGRAFCRRMINLLSGASRGHHRIRLGREFRADLAWWRMFVAQWNGIGLAPSVCVCSMPPLYTDASGSWGCGASWNQHWFQLTGLEPGLTFHTCKTSCPSGYPKCSAA